MFGTKLGASAESAMDLYLRPETAQGIFVNFLNVQKTGRMKIPFGIAQTGKAFRNEIVARQFIFRMREFEQMEMQFFIKPGTQGEWYKHWKEKRLSWHLSLGMGEENYRFHDHEKLAHYADAAADIEFRFLLALKNLKVFIPEQILTLVNMKNTLAKNFNFLILKKTKTMFLMS